jgi:SAM-dependent methyltransferase
MSSADRLEATVQALKSAAEPTRLRLLAVLSHGELQVGEVCRILGQSQPRISRHLRLLTEAGFLDRFREQQCVYYRTPAHSTRMGWLRQLLEEMDRDEPVLRRDRERMAQVVAARARAAARDADPDVQAGEGAVSQFAASLLEEIGPVGIGELLDIGTGGGELLEVLARRARHAVGIDISAQALRLARARLHGAGLSHCEFHRGDMYQLPVDDASFDTVTMDRVLAGARAPQLALGEAARALRPGGRLIIVERLEQLEEHGSARPLQQLRRWLDAAGLHAERFRPCQLPAGDILIATARRGAATGEVRS